MDYARKIGKSTEPKKWVRQPPSVLTLTDEPLCPDRTHKEDNRLKNWRRWLSNRKTQFDHIKSKTGVPPPNQVMNSCETVRPLVETRTIMDHAAQPLPVIPDKYRGGPEFWNIPPSIPKSNPCLPNITFAPSKKDLNEAPDFIHVGLPELIEEEKGLAGLSSKTPLWKRSEYLRKRKVELAEELQMLPPKPRSRQLVIKNRVLPKKVEIPRVPPITISHVEEEELCDYPLQTAVLKIQDVEICQTFVSESEDSEPIRWNVTFNSKVSHMDEKEIVFENKGNRVIIYQWRDAMFRSKAMPVARHISPFFFNKTKGVILPGQFVRLKIWYRSRSPGVFIESWKLITDPQLCSAPFIFRLWGHTLTRDRNFTGTSRIIDEYLDHCIRNSVIREIIEEIMEDIYSVEPPGPAYGSLFLESEVFLAKNAMCSYSPSLLIEFRKIYRSATHSKEDQWNLSIKDLRDIILKIKHQERRRQLLTQLNEVYKKCLMPTLYKPVRSNKYEVVQNLLAYLFNRFEIESQMSKRTCCREMNSVSQIDCEVVTNRSVMNDFAYREIFFIRVYQLLAETLEQIFASIDSFNNLTDSDK
ncbi:MYCBP-associated protein [Megachile rotundata]|uniref:MYCBP-associated protein n=1 Tax=Megachile rotundata TaxID=143995 RepID=UPI003FCF7F73